MGDCGGVGGGGGKEGRGLLEELEGTLGVALEVGVVGFQGEDREGLVGGEGGGEVLKVTVGVWGGEVGTVERD